MRLCVIGNFNSIHTQRWMRYFMDRGYDVHGVSYAPSTATIEGATLHALVKSLPPARPRNAGRAGTGGRRGQQYGWHVATHGMAWLRHGLKRTVRAIRPDILHGHFVIEHGVYAALSGFSPLVVSAWGSDLLLHPQASAINRALVGYALRRSALVHSLSPALSEQVRCYGVPTERILTVPLGVEESWLQVRPAPRTGTGPVLINMKSFSSVYNIAMLIKAAALARARHPGLVVKLIGDGPLRGDLEALAASLDMRGHVEFLGVVSRPRLLELLSGADLLVSPSFSEGASVSLLEAMALGVIPVVSDIPANRDWITPGHNGFLASPEDVQALAEAIHTALTQPEAWKQQAVDRNKAIIRARAVWQDQMRRVEAAYQELVR